MNIAVDMGSCNTRIAIEKKGILINEPSVIAYDTFTEDILAVGKSAFKMIGKTSKRAKAVYPIGQGAIGSNELVEKMISTFLGNTGKGRISMPKIVASIPGNVTEVEKRAMVNSISSYGVRRVYLIENAKAAAIGAGIDIMKPEGFMVADLGGGTADIAVLSLGGVASGISIKKAGNEMDDLIIRYIKKKYNLIIGKNMAEACKMEIGCVKKPIKEETHIVKGLDLKRGLPRAILISSSEILEAIEDVALGIIRGMVEVLEAAPPDLTGDILLNGIVLTGGLAHLKGMKELISDYINVDVKIADDAETCTIRGCEKAINYINLVENETGHQINPLLAAY